jgi:2-polyprenyl-3-methyl-5-hydroxy-6-metoxy-1,4-benzoquinol methylase
MSQRINMASEYAERGEYHRYLDPNWSYYPTYLAKMKFIRHYLRKIPKTAKILDVGCGEGVLVEEFANLGYNIIGLDQNYSSAFVLRGDIRTMPFGSKSFDVILCLDVLEHLSYESQEIAIREIRRVLKDDGRVIFSLPNLAHFSSRLSFLLRGKLSRTGDIKKHPGDRPLKEYLQLLSKEGFRIIQRKALSPTFPVIYQLVRTLTAKTRSSRFIDFLNLFALPDWSFDNILICAKGKI